MLDMLTTCLPGIYMNILGPNIADAMSKGWNAEGRDRLEKSRGVGMRGMIGCLGGGGLGCMILGYYYILICGWVGGAFSSFFTASRCFFTVGTTPPFSLTYYATSSTSPLLLFSFFFLIFENNNWNLFFIAFSVRPSSMRTNLHHFF